MHQYAVQMISDGVQFPRNMGQSVDHHLYWTVKITFVGSAVCDIFYKKFRDIVRILHIRIISYQYLVVPK